MTDRSPVPAVSRESVVPMRALWSALDAAAAPASTLATLAALVRALTPSDYGILVIAIAASGLSMAVNPAIAATTTKFVSELSREPHPGARSIAGVISVSLMSVAVIDLVLLLGTAVFNGQLSSWIFGDDVSAHNLGLVLFLAVLSIAIQQIETVLAAAIRGMERFRRQALIEVISRIALTVAVIYVAWHTRSLVAILNTQCAVCLASTLVRTIALRRLLPGGRLFELSGRMKAGTVFRYGGWMWLAALAGVAYTSADRIIIGRSLGTAAAGQYNIYVQITQLIHFIPSSVFAFSFPAFSRLAALGGNQSPEIARTYRVYLLAIGTLAGGLAAAMMLSWPLLLRIVTGAEWDSRFGAPGLLTLNFLLLAFNVAPYYVLLALGQARTVAVVTTASMLAALVLMTILIPRFGLEGAALSRLAYGIGALMLLLRAHRLLRRS
jgi:O-antigen/teichoic acid export membrane protein